MSTTIRSLLLGLVLLSNACAATGGAGSSRSVSVGGGGPGGAAGGEGRMLDAPAAAELRSYEPAVAPRDTPEVGEAPSFRIESDCWVCR